MQCCYGLADVGVSEYEYVFIYLYTHTHTHIPALSIVWEENILLTPLFFLNSGDHDGRFPDGPAVFGCPAFYFERDTE